MYFLFKCINYIVKRKNHISLKSLPQLSILWKNVVPLSEIKIVSNNNVIQTFLNDNVTKTILINNVIKIVFLVKIWFENYSVLTNCL